MQSLRNLFRRSPSLPRPPSTRSAQPFAMVLNPDGSLVGVKSEGLELLVGSDLASVSQQLQHDERSYALAYVASEWAFRCLNVRANKASELLSEAQVVDITTGDPVPSHGLQLALDRAYSHYRQDLFRSYFLNLDIFGDAFIEKISATSPFLGTLQIPWGLRVLPGLAVEPFIQGGHLLGYQYYSEDGRIIQFKLDQIAYDFTYNPFSTQQGMSLLAGAMNAVNLDLFVMRHNTSYFRNGARPGLVIAPKTGEQFTDETYQKITEWISKNQGVQNFFKVLPLSRPVDVTTIEYPELEDQVLLSKDQRERICARTGVPLGLVSFSDQPYQLSPQQRITLYSETIMPLARRALRFFNVNVKPFFDPNNEVELRFDQRLVSALMEDEAAKDQIVRSRYQAGQITFNEMREAIGQAAEAKTDFYLMPAGQPVPANQLASFVAEWQNKPAVPALNFQLGAAATPASLAASGAQGAPVTHTIRSHSKGSLGVPDGTAVLYLWDVEGLLTVQQALMRSVPSDAPIRWTPLHQLHVTLAHAPLVDEPAFRTVFEKTQNGFSGFELRVSEVSTFDTDGDRVPIVALVEPSAELAVFQAELARQFAASGVTLSKYSLPENWTPHITLGYAAREVASSFDINGELGIRCTAGVLAFTRGDYEVIESKGCEPASPEKATGQQEDVASELHAWRKVAMRRGAGKALDFECTHLPGYVQAYLLDWIGYLDTVATLKAVDDDFTTARTRDLLRAFYDTAGLMTGVVTPEKAIYGGDTDAAVKAIQATRVDFELKFEDMLALAREGEWDRRRWSTNVRNLIRWYATQAYIDGKADGGVADEGLEPDEQAEVNAWIADQSQYVTNLGELLFGKGISDTLADVKPGLWFDKSIFPMYHAGRASADANGIYEWLIGRTEEHCKTCLAASGQRHRLKQWLVADIVPQGDKLECGGWLCDCKLTRTKERARGRLSAIPIKAVSCAA